MKTKATSPTVQLAIKKLFAPTGLFIVLLVFFVSCQDHDLTPVDKQENINKSEITLMEESLGVRFFKKVITVTDEEGENKLIIRIAALDEGFLDEYINSRTFSIVPIVEKRTIKSRPVAIIDNENQIEENAGADIASKILIEILARELKPGVVGVGFRDAPNSDYRPTANGRTKYIYNNVEYVSPNWPEYLALQAYNQITFSLQRKSKWYSGWSTILWPETWCCGQYETFGIDGPYRVKLIISYNDFDSDFYHEWFW